jgi:hypothetical protein
LRLLEEEENRLLKNLANSRKCEDFAIKELEKAVIDSAKGSMIRLEDKKGKHKGWNSNFPNSFTGESSPVSHLSPS